MNIFEVCEKYQISLAKARKMEKGGVLRLDENTPEKVQEIRHLLMRGQPLSAAHLVELLDNAGWTLDLGRYADKAQSMLDELGDARAEKAPESVAMYIPDASSNVPEAVEILMRWAMKIIPAHPVRHNYLATRLLLGDSPLDRPADAPRIGRAIHYIRKRPEFADYWHTIPTSGNRNAAIYQHKPKKMLDL